MADISRNITKMKLKARIRKRFPVFSSVYLHFTVVEIGDQEFLYLDYYY